MGSVERSRFLWVDSPSGVILLSCIEQSRSLFKIKSGYVREEISYLTLEEDVSSLTLSFLVVEKLELKRLKSLKSHGGVDRALLSFDLKVDLAPAFHWNIKQLFVYVVAQYETEGRMNQVVLWDKIVEAADPKIIDESNVFVKYALVDQGDELRGKNVKLQLQWDHMPITGFVYMNSQPIESASSFDLPSEYQ